MPLCVPPMGHVKTCGVEMISLPPCFESFLVHDFEFYDTFAAYR